MKTIRYSIAILFMTMAIACSVYADGITLEDSELFPLPASLKPNVEFWIKVYSNYRDYEVAIHDNVDLSIIYEVIDMRDFGDAEDISSSDVWRHVEERQKKYETCLRSMGELRIIVHDNLSELERKLYTLFGRNTNPAVYREAAGRIRAQRGLKDRFKEGLIRSGRYDDYIKKMLRNQGVPEEISVLPHVESSFNIHAYSKFGAAGLWQFTRATGRLFMDIDYAVDQRLDPETASEAAAKLLKRNYDILGTWPLALTAYNHGTSGMKRAIREMQTTDIGVITSRYSSRQFKFASRNFYAEFLAAKHVVENYQDYFGDLEFDKPLIYHKLVLPNYIKISAICELTDLTIEKLHEYNPSLRPSVLSSARHIPKGFELKIPWQGDDFDPRILLASIPAREKLDKQIESNWYQVQSGDNLRGIARRAGTSVEEIMALNEDIIDIHRIYVNQIIRLPETDVVQLAEAQSKEASIVEDKMSQVDHETTDHLLHEKKEPSGTPQDDSFYHTIKGGDILERIAAHYNTTVDQILSLNDIKDKNKLVIGQRIRVAEERHAATQLADAGDLSFSDVDTIPSYEPIADLVEAIPHGPTTDELMQTGIYQKNPADVDTEVITETNHEEEAEEIPVPEPQITIQTTRPLSTSTETNNVLQKHELSAAKFSDMMSEQIAIYSLETAKSDTTIGKIYILPDETLGHYADWLEVPTQAIRDWNGLSFYASLQLGKSLRLHFNKVGQKLFMQRRLEYRKSIEEDFYQNFFVEGVQLHRLRRGESVWELTNVVYEVPYWMMMKYNPTVNFNSLRPGDEIIIPIIRANEG